MKKYIIYLVVLTAILSLCFVCISGCGDNIEPETPPIETTSIESTTPESTSPESTTPEMTAPESPPVEPTAPETLAEIFDIITPVEIEPLTLGDDGEYENVIRCYSMSGAYEAVESVTNSFRIGNQNFYDMVLESKRVYADSGNDYCYSFEKYRQCRVDVYTDGGFEVKYNDEALYHYVDDDFVLGENTLIEYVKETVLLYSDIDFSKYDVHITTWSGKGDISGFTARADAAIKGYNVRFQRKAINGIVVLDFIWVYCDPSGNIYQIKVEGQTNAWYESELDTEAYLAATEKFNVSSKPIQINVYDGRIVWNSPREDVTGVDYIF